MYRKFFKRVFDIICALLTLTVFSWLYIILIILVACTMKGCVFFKQVRVGKNNKLFYIYKFRTMNNKVDKNGNLLSDKERLTKFGRWLRNTSLDEIPEAINILIGNMSVIGPRPLLVRDYVFFDEEILKRQTVTPGLSGWAQINGRNDITWEDKFKFDVEYVNKMSFWLDIKIVFKTVGKVFFKKEGVNRSGYDTDLDFGDYLLKEGKITQKEYDDKHDLAKEIKESYVNKKNKKGCNK